MSSQLLILSFLLVAGHFANSSRETPPYEKSAYETATILISSMIPRTVRGTRWCGHDVAAKSYEHLGDAVETDKCCREWHDCDDFIPPHGERYEIHNPANYKMLLCRCNEVFHGCLKNVTGMELPTATQIGVAYFDVVSPKCLKKMYYAPTCEVSYYDTNGNKYSENKDSEYFCPQSSPSMAW